MYLHYGQALSKLVRICRCALVEERTLPGPFAIDLNLKRPAQERTDEHNKPKHANACEGRIDSDAVNDVGSNQEFQPEHDRSPQVQAQMAISHRAVTQTDEGNEGSHERDD